MARRLLLLIKLLSATTNHWLWYEAGPEKT